MTKVLVIGYPKSGNTWLTRLVAELIDCPVKGFFEEPWNDEMAIEGQGRQSKYSVFKGHQSFMDIIQKVDKRKLIYVVRDVRDIAVSGARFFGFPPSSLPEKRLYNVPLIGRKIYHKLYLTEPRKIQKMIQVLDKGNPGVNIWCEIPWDEHIKPYLENEVLIIKYENLLSNPKLECEKILSYLNIKRSEEKILESIEKQGFKAVKEKFKKTGDKRRANLLKKGKSGIWSEKLTQEQKVFLKTRFRDTLESLGYLNT